MAVGFFTDEEGARFPPDMLGSLVYVGGMAVEDALSLVQPVGYCTDLLALMKEQLLSPVVQVDQMV